MHTHINAFTHTCAHMHAHKLIHTHAFMHTRTYICMHTCAHKTHMYTYAFMIRREINALGSEMQSERCADQCESTVHIHLCLYHSGPARLCHVSKCSIKPVVRDVTQDNRLTWNHNRGRWGDSVLTKLRQLPLANPELARFRLLRY